MGKEAWVSGSSPYLAAARLEGPVPMRKQILGPGASEEWLIDTVDLKTTHRQTETFDAPVVATGHYNDPFVRRNARSLDRQTSD